MNATGAWGGRFVDMLRENAPSSFFVSNAASSAVTGRGAAQIARLPVERRKVTYLYNVLSHNMHKKIKKLMLQPSLPSMHFFPSSSIPSCLSFNSLLKSMVEKLLLH